MYFGRELSEWVLFVHTAVCKIYNCPVFNIAIDTYGYDSYSVVLQSVLENVKPEDIFSYLRKDLDITRFVDVAHSAWSKNYIDWKNRSSKPDILDDDEQKNICTTSRNDRSTSYARNLKEIDQGVYHDIINTLFDELANNIIKSGMMNLTL